MKFGDFQIQYVAILFLILRNGCHGYPSGAPSSACGDMTPHHGAVPQKSNPPYQIKLSTYNLTNGENITVSLVSPSNEDFEGYLIEVFTASNKTDQFIDSTIDEVPSNAHTTCNGGVTHSDKSIKMNATFSWTPTVSFTGQLLFRATVVKNFSTYWLNIESQLLTVDVSLPTSQPTTTGIDSTTNTENNTEPFTTMQTTTSVMQTTTSVGPAEIRCLPQKGCFKSCTTKMCGVVQWQHVDSSVEFTVITEQKPGRRWQAIGFSETGKMGGSSVVMCINNNGKISIGDGHNNGYSFNELSNRTLGITDAGGKVEGNLFSCTFSRQIEDLQDPLFYSLRAQYYLLLGQGPVGQTGIPTEHEVLPSVSSKKVDFLVNENVNSDDSPSAMIKLHGCLMVISWMLFSSTGIVIARYFKSEWPDKMPFGLKVWFVVHRIIMTCVLLLTAVGFVLIFVEIGVAGVSQTSHEDVYARSHPFLGITVMILTIVNPVMAFFRCSPGHRHRHVFHWSHLLVGQSAQILAGTTIFFGLNLQKSNVPIETRYIFYGYVGTYVLIEVILGTHRQIMKSRKEEEVQGSPLTPLIKHKPSESNSFKIRMLGLHILSMTVYAGSIVFLVARS